MRILVISNLYPPVLAGGYEARCAHTVNWLAREHETLVLTSRRGRRGLEREPGVLRELPFLTQDARGSLRAPLASLRAARIVRRTLSSFRPDLVFVWNASEIPRVAVRIVQSTGCPLAFSVADPWFAGYTSGDQFMRHLHPGDRGLRRVWATFIRLVNRLPSLRVEIASAQPAAIAWNSAALRELVTIPACVTPVLERVIHPASAHEELFAGLARRPTASPTIAFVGRLSWEKAPDVAYRALALLRERHGIEARLIAVGSIDGAMRRELAALARELAVEDRVEVRGPLPPEGVAEVLAGAHALVVPSRWQEPFGLVCLEGALARVPIVASRSGGMPEMLAPEQEALFFEIDDAEACAAALARTLGEVEQTTERVARALRRARTYSLARYRADYDAFVEDALRACLAERPGAPPARPLNLSAGRADA